MWRLTYLMSTTEDKMGSEWADLINYVSDLLSIVGEMDVELLGDTMRISFEDALIRVVRMVDGWSITYESEDVMIKVADGRAEYRRGGRACLSGVDTGACKDAAKALAFILGLVAAYNVSEELLFKRFFKQVETLSTIP
jgi:hypothetical protein